jgi:hypothetical protein
LNRSPKKPLVIPEPAFQPKDEVLERLGITPLTGWCLDDWSKAVAVDDALRRSTADAVIISDADVWPHGWDDPHGQHNPVYATQTLLNDHPWVMPFDTVVRLDPAATSAVLTGDPPDPNATLTQRPYRGLLGGGFLAIRRDVYDDCPLDARFVGWGQEDEAWGDALAALQDASRQRQAALQERIVQASAITSPIFQSV